MYFRTKGSLYCVLQVLKKDPFNKNDFWNKTQIFGIHFVYYLKLLNFAASVIYLVQSLQ